MTRGFCQVTLLSLFGACGALVAQTSGISFVGSAASYIPQQVDPQHQPLPNSGIAQGSMFVVKGAGLGPASLVVAKSFPLLTTMAGTSVTVSVGGANVNALIYYTSDNQVAAILPSSTPTGGGTVAVTYKGQTAYAMIAVVASNVGVFTVNQGGTGDAIVFHADNTLVTPLNAATRARSSCSGGRVLVRSPTTRAWLRSGEI